MAKILQLCAVDFTAYHLLKPLGAGLCRAGHRVTFCCTAGEGLDLLQREGFKTAAIPFSRNYNLLRHALSLVRLHKLLRRERFDIIHCHTPVAGLIGRVAARLARVPIVVYTAHGFYFHEEMGPASRRIFVSLERFGGALTDMIFVQSREDFEDALKERIIDPERLVHIGNGVDPTLFGRDVHAQARESLAAELGLEGGPVVGFTGRIVREKGVVEFTRAAAEIKKTFPGSRFLMVGAPLESDRDDSWSLVEGLGRELGLHGSLVMTGYRRDVPALMSLMDVFVLPSYREGMPRSLIEAMATGLPVVATDIRGCREEVVDGETGYLVPPRQHLPIAAAVVKLIGSDELASAMGRAARERVLERFDERAIVDFQVRMLESLSGAKSDN
jgi:glycosyltransferase involved in cell wall biosynthesis